MKNLLLIVFVSLLLFSCKQKDTQEPQIYLNGDNPMTITLGTWWEDPGATVDDNFDGNSIQNTITVTHNIDINGPANGEGPTKVTGTYQVTYTAKDKSGNVATVVRTVNVVNSSEKYATKYETNINSGVPEQFVHDTTIMSPSYQALTFDTRINHKIWIPKLGGIINENVSPMVNSIRVGAYFVSDSIQIPRQTYYIKVFNGTDTIPYIYQVMGTVGQSKITDTIGLEFILNYKLERYKINNATGQWDTLGNKWKIDKYDNVKETWISY